MSLRQAVCNRIASRADPALDLLERVDSIFNFDTPKYVCICFNDDSVEIVLDWTLGDARKDNRVCEMSIVTRKRGVFEQHLNEDAVVMQAHWHLEGHDPKTRTWRMEDEDMETAETALRDFFKGAPMLKSPVADGSGQATDTVEHHPR